MAAVAAPGFPGWVIEHGYLRELQPWETLRDDLPSARTSPIVAPPPRNSLDPARARLERLLLDDAPPPPPPRPLISTRVIDGRLPSAAKVRAAEAAVDHVPAAIRAKLSRAGARIELIAGVDVAAHPQFSHHPHARYCGMTKFAEPFAAVAVDADRDPGATVLHELGHILDQVAAHPSRSAGWGEIWERDKRSGKVSAFADQRTRPSEYFAESFSRLWSPRPGVWPSSRAAERFIMGLC
jgi:hypothetical protein